jgi:glucokinase
MPEQTSTTLTSGAVGTRIAIGIDIGGTKIGVARVNLDAIRSDDQGELIELYQRTPTPSETQPFIEAIVSMVETVRLESAGLDIGAVGISTAGIVNSAEGKIMGSTGNLPAVQGVFPIKTILEERLNLPVYAENDANAAAYGECRAGAGKGYENVLMVTLGTGVGTGLVVNGKMVHGAHFSAGEGGHIAIDLHRERLCTCGRWDCWETYASGTGLAETARRMLAAAPNAHYSQMLIGHKEIEDVTTHDVIRAQESGNPMANEMLETWHLHIATGMGSLINVLDPAVVVVGGGMAKFVDFELLRKLTAHRAMPKDTRIEPAMLGNTAGIVGAAILAMESIAS